ncbi:MAG: phosphomannomutase/phosphoglucomutase [Alphaproteobacteria bacterium]|jgi:phosphomannomutase|nr:phosphomannomutase/phosphoglucomutase [Alphaproteobacteria bacterium]
MNRHSFDPTILRAYDIRGIYEQTLHGEDAFAIGIAFAAMQQDRGFGPRVAVGRDGRLSSPALAAQLAEGLQAGGAEVIDIGCGPTPMLYFAAHELDTGGAIQVTGSHNPPTHNGFKMVMGGHSFFGDDISALGEASRAGVARRSGGMMRHEDIQPAYIDRLASGARASGLSVIWDCGNGASGPVTEALVDRLDGQHKVLFPDIDGTFPNHHPNPVDPETLDLLRAEVAEAGADLGIGFDGDGDRIGVIDATGRQVPGDFLTAYLAQDIATRHAGAPIILDVKSSEAALRLIGDCGGTAEIWKTGHSHMKRRMKEISAPLAGEMSGHIFIKDGYLGFDDAIYAGVRVITQMVETGQSITAFMDSLPAQHATPELRIDCEDTRKFGAMDRIHSHVLTRHDEANVNAIDGVRVRSAAGWWLIRASNTEAALVARAEAGSAAGLEQLVDEIRTTLKAAGLDWHHP